MVILSEPWRPDRCEHHVFMARQALEALHSGALAVWHLQRVLAKKRDPLSHILFSSALATAGSTPPLTAFW